MEKVITNEEKKSLMHALYHVEENRIHTPGGYGFYFGKKTDFIKRHKKTIELLENWLMKDEE